MIIKVRYKDSRFKLELNDKITVVMGNSGTGKSTLALAVSDMNIGVSTISIYPEDYSVKSSLTKDTIVSTIKNAKNTVFIIDESTWRVCRSTEVEKEIQRNKTCYFLFTCRYSVNLNYSINAVKVFKVENNITILSDFMTVNKIRVPNTVSISHCITEDTGKGFGWFSKLFNKSDITVLDSEITYMENGIEHTASGKDSYCKRITEFMRENPGSRVLMIFDSISFGSCVAAYLELLKNYGCYLYVIDKYKSFEHLILNTNMFRGYKIKYDISSGMFEEAYYEKALELLSSGKYTSIKHDAVGSKIKSCYTEVCTKCPGVGDCKFVRVVKCKDDKFVALLKDTEFEELLILARREI